MRKFVSATGIERSFGKITEWGLKTAGAEVYYAIINADRMQWNEGGVAPLIGIAMLTRGGPCPALPARTA